MTDGRMDRFGRDSERTGQGSAGKRWGAHKLPGNVDGCLAGFAEPRGSWAMPIERVAYWRDRRRPWARRSRPSSAAAPTIRAVLSKGSGSHRRVISPRALAINLPDISRTMSKLIVTFAIPDDQQTPRPVRAAPSERARSWHLLERRSL